MASDLARQLSRQLEATRAALLFRVVGGPPMLTRMIDDGDDQPLYMVQFWREPGLVEVVKLRGVPGREPGASVVTVYFAADGAPDVVDWLHRAGLAELADERDASLRDPCEICGAAVGEPCRPRGRDVIEAERAAADAVEAEAVSAAALAHEAALADEQGARDDIEAERRALAEDRDEP